MRVTVIGAGAIGSLVAGYLKNQGREISLVGHADAVKAIQAAGLKISGVRGDFTVPLEITEKLTGAADLVILATKTQDIEAAIKDNLQFLSNSLILTTQNGIQADYLAAKYLDKEKIISSIVMFGATCLKPGEVVHNFEGSWIIGRLSGKNDTSVEDIGAVLNKIFPVVPSEELLGMKYLKIFVNANNCIPAILGKSMQEAFADPPVSSISIAIWKEGLEIVQKSKINLVSLPDFPLERLTKLTALPAEAAAKIYSGIMMNLSKEPLYGSILQSIRRGRPSEIDYLNGEFVALAKKNGLRASLNEKLVELVHRVEKNGSFLSKEELLTETKGLYN
ncbi:MAG: ketopantoate reductase family protein [Candidatus Omnitrophota bacterium]|jgi:2-dehydropantoate 2-reductase